MRYVLTIFTPPPFLPPGCPPPQLPHPLNILCPYPHFTQGVQLVLPKSSWLWSQLWSMADLPGSMPLSKLALPLPEAVIVSLPVSP